MIKKVLLAIGLLNINFFIQANCLTPRALKFIKSISVKIDVVEGVCLPGVIKDFDSNKINQFLSELQYYESALSGLAKTTNDFLVKKNCVLELYRINNLNRLFDKKNCNHGSCEPLDWSKVK